MTRISAWAGLILAVMGLTWPISARAQGMARTGAEAIDYVVRPGDTLSGLANRYLVRPAAWREVSRVNRIADPDKLLIGRVLRLPLALLRAEPAQARIATVRGPVSLHRNSGRVVAAAIGDTVAEGAVLSTGANGFVRLTLPDGGHVSLPSRSRVRIDRLRTILLNGATDQLFQLENGRVESEAAPVRRPGGFSIATPISVSAVRGTSFRNSWNPDAARGGTEVIEGVVAVGAGTSELVIGEAEGVSASSAGLTSAALLPAPELLDPDVVQTGDVVTLRLAPAPGAAFFRARLAADAGMVEAFAEGESLPGQAEVVLPEAPDGLHFVRVSAVSEDGLEGLAKVYTLIRVRSGADGLAAESSGTGRNRQYLFRWEAEGEGPAEFRFELRLDGADTPLVDETGLAEPRLTLTGLPPGEYQWRVRITRRKFGRLIETWSDSQALRIGR